MTDEDMELTRLAAKAASIELEPGTTRIAGTMKIWRPRDDDGDAMRLAVKLNLLNNPRFLHERDFLKFSMCVPELEATRRAICQVAAEIGKAKIEAESRVERLKQEPVAWRWLYNGVPDSEKCFPMPGPDHDTITKAAAYEFPRTVQYLYAKPQPVQEWVGFKDVADIRRTANSLRDDFSWIEFAEAIEKELKERNTCQIYQKL